MDNTNQTESNGRVGRICLLVELDGIPHVVTLDRDSLGMLVKMAALMHMGKLPAVPAPEGFEFPSSGDPVKHDQEVPNV